MPVGWAMEEVLIVDGYNVIGAAARRASEPLGAVALEEARQALVDALADYQAVTGRRVIVVFDAHRTAGPAVTTREHGVIVTYTAHGETADERIERLVGEWLSPERRVYVATSDAVEQWVVFARGALRLPARELLHELAGVRRDVAARMETLSPPRTSLGDRMPEEIAERFEKWRRNGDSAS